MSEGTKVRPLPLNWSVLTGNPVTLSSVSHQPPLPAKRKLRIGLDLDGICYDFERTMRYLLRTVRGVPRLEVSKEWDSVKNAVSKEDWDWLWTEGVERWGLFRYGHMYTGAIEGVRELAKIGKVVVITNRPSNAVPDTSDWISYIKLPFHEIHVLGASVSKTSVPHCDIYIDDNSQITHDILLHTRATVYLWNRPWNQGYNPEHRRFRRVSNWKEIIEDVAA